MYLYHRSTSQKRTAPLPTAGILLTKLAVIVALVVLAFPKNASADVTIGDDRPLFPPITNAGNRPNTSCLYPSTHERFGLTVGGDITAYDVAELSSAAYLNWSAQLQPLHPNGMDYYPLIYVNEAAFQPYGYWPSSINLEWRVRNNPGATWLIGNEADYRRHNDQATPEAYARIYHDVYTTIKALDPSARIAANSLATVSTLRLAWLDQVWDSYREQFGQDMPVDAWTIHSYTVNEMVHEWGPEFPPGFDNVVGFGAGQWQQIGEPQASGGAIHRSNDPGARAYFAFRGDEVTVYLRTGPDAGLADIYIDNRAWPPNPPDPPLPAETVDLYAPVPGILSRTYGDLPASADPILGRRHHVRVQVTGNRNPASSDAWVRVDAVQAESTASLPGGRLEDDHPLRGRIVTTAQDHDNLDTIVAQIRLMRQWMADHGQRNKPLINTEFGVLMGESLGFDSDRVQDFMLGSFDLFIDDQALVDPLIGMPDDGNRLLQQWFWFILAMDYFDGSRVHTGLFNPTTREILPLGQAYADYVQVLFSYYIDLKAAYLTLTPSWPLFAGEAAQVEIRASVRNRGNQASGFFDALLADDTRTIEQWQVAGLSEAHGGNDSFDIDMTWEPVVTGDRVLTLTADSSGIIDEPCDPNNVQTATLVAPPFVDLALSNLTVTPRYPDHRTNAIRIDVDLANLGSQGMTSDRIVVSFWDGNPDQGGRLLYIETLLPGQNLRRASVSYRWQDFSPGRHEVFALVTPRTNDLRISNNRQSLEVIIPDGDHIRFFPLIGRQERATQRLEIPSFTFSPWAKFQDWQQK